MLICLGNIFKSKKSIIKRIWMLVYISLLFRICKQEARGALLHIPSTIQNHFHFISRYESHPSHYAAIKPTPENARILLLAPTIIVGCAIITSAAGFYTAAQYSPQHRDGPNRNISMAAPGSRPRYWSCKLLYSASHSRWCVRCGRLFFGRAEVSDGDISIDLICASKKCLPTDLTGTCSGIEARPRRTPLPALDYNTSHYIFFGL
jgi:hypothetical protein